MPYTRGVALSTTNVDTATVHEEASKIIPTPVRPVDDFYNAARCTVTRYFPGVTLPRMGGREWRLAGGCALGRRDDQSRVLG